MLLINNSWIGVEFGDEFTQPTGYNFDPAKGVKLIKKQFLSNILNCILSKKYIYDKLRIELIKNIYINILMYVCNWMSLLNFFIWFLWGWDECSGRMKLYWRIMRTFTMKVAIQFDAMLP